VVREIEDSKIPETIRPCQGFKILPEALRTSKSAGQSNPNKYQVRGGVIVPETTGVRARFVCFCLSVENDVYMLYFVSIRKLFCTLLKCRALHNEVTICVCVYVCVGDLWVKIQQYQCILLNESVHRGSVRLRNSNKRQQKIKDIQNRLPYEPYKRYEESYAYPRRKR